jgi:hypothetical protein
VKCRESGPSYDVFTNDVKKLARLPIIHGTWTLGRGRRLLCMCDSGVSSV